MENGAWDSREKENYFKRRNLVRVHLTTKDKFTWQEGYGVFSLGGKQLEQAVVYVQNQKLHHLNGSALAKRSR